MAESLGKRVLTAVVMAAVLLAIVLWLAPWVTVVVLTLLALAWLIWTMSPRRKRGTCVACGRPVRECICGT